VIEFQKRMLPLMHFLIFLAPEDKIHDVTQIDHIVCAKFPNQDEDPILFNIILETLQENQANMTIVVGMDMTK
jgi:hypothetical protein